MPPTTGRLELPGPRMTPAPSPDRRHQLQWVVLDARFHLLAVGDALYRGVSPRTTLDPAARRILLPEMGAVAGDGKPRQRNVEAFNRRWTVRALPVLGAVSGKPLAMLGCYGPEGTPFPPRPSIGSWEWKVTPPGPDQQVRTYWSDELYDVYGIPKPAAAARVLSGRAPDTLSWWEGPQYLDELVADHDRPQMRRIVDEFLTASTDALYVHCFTGRNPFTGELRKLRMAGRSEVSEPGETTWFRGTTLNIDHLSPDQNDLVGARDYLDAALALSREAMIGIDTSYEHIYLTTGAFSQLGVRLPPSRWLPKMCHHDDLETLRHMLKQAGERPNDITEPVRVRFRSTDGNWRWLEMAGTGVRRPTGEPYHVLCRVSPADPAIS